MEPTNLDHCLLKRLCLEFSEKPVYVITEGNDENEDEYDEQITHT